MSRVPDTSSQPRHRASVLAGAVGAFLVTAVTLPATADGEDRPSQLPLTVSVKRIGEGGSPPAGMPQEPAPATPTAQTMLPDARMPQYQIRHEQRLPLSGSQLSDPALRFLLALPAQPILIEARITIDGQAYPLIRERRIAQIIEELGRPVVAAGAESSQSTPASESTEETGGTPAAGAPGEAPQAAAPSATPATLPPFAPAITALAAVRRYVSATGATPNADEIRSLLTEWIDGPVVLLLRDHFQRFRAHQRPAFHMLDRDRDGEISTGEWSLASQSLQECDLNRDDIVTFLEIAESANDPRRQSPVTDRGGYLVTVLPVASRDSARQVFRRLRSQYATSIAAGRAPLNGIDSDGNGELEVGELEQLRARAADITLTLAFDTDDASASALTIAAVDGNRVRLIPAGDVPAPILRLLVDGVELQISALQGAPSDQVSLGAVEDGYPLLPSLDPNGDDRLTIRERRELMGRLATFDENGDRRLTAAEVRSPFRLCLGLGPVVHRELEVLRALSLPASTPPLAGPDWFVRMDHNSDRDLTRSEFPGTDEQFSELDFDGDGLVSAAEATEFEKRPAAANDKVNSVPPAVRGTQTSKAE